MKIAFVNEKYVHHSTGGAHQSVRILAESLVSLGHEVCVWTTTHRADQPESVETLGGVKVVHLPIANLYWPHGHRPAPLKPLWHAVDAFNPGMAARVGRWLDREKPDVLHTNIIASFSPSVWRAAHRRGVPIVHTLRDHYMFCPSGEMFTPRGNCARQCGVCGVYSAPKKLASRYVDAVVGISDYLLQAHLSKGYFPASRVRKVIHNSYAPDGALPTDRAPGEALRVGYLGRLCETKGIELLIDAVAALPGDAVRLLIAGDGEPDYERGLRARCAAGADRRVSFLGVVPPGELFGQIDVLVVPSLWREPFGRIVIEANAWGIPVVASRRGGLPEIVEEGATGFLFEPRADELARRLCRLTPARCASMREACLQKARQFLPATIAGEYEALYRQLIESPRAAVQGAGQLAPAL